MGVQVTIDDIYIYISSSMHTLYLVEEKIKKKFILFNSSRKARKVVKSDGSPMDPHINEPDIFLKGPNDWQYIIASLIGLIFKNSCILSLNSNLIKFLGVFLEMSITNMSFCICV